MSTIEGIQSKISKQIHDLKPAAKGEMTLYSHSKELRIQISTAQQIQKSTLVKFTQQIEELKPIVAMFISCNDDIPFNVQSSPCLTFFITSKELTKRFVEYLGSLPNINEPEEEEESEEESKDTKPKEKKPKISFIESYEPTLEGFDKYCHEVSKSKIEFKKAQEKWSEQMKVYSKLSDFQEYIVSLKPPKPDKPDKSEKKEKEDKTEKEEKPEPKGTIEEFQKYIKDTALSKITKSYIKDNFGNLDNSITFLNETKDFKKKISDYKKTL